MIINNMKIPIEISARHVHLSEKDFEKLFGKDKSLHKFKDLSQPGEFAAEEIVALISPKKEIKDVRILGPFRGNSQVEISVTDAYSLKLDPFPKIKVSGDLSGTTKILVKGPEGSIKIPCIIAKRHLHCDFETAEKLKIKNNEKISVKVSGERETIFSEIVVRIGEGWILSMHVDTDEGNAAGITGKTFGEIVR